MSDHRIILANDSRLLRGMLKRAIDKAPGLRIVGEIADLAMLPSAVERMNPEWAIVSLSSDGSIPKISSAVLSMHSSVRILAMTVDGTQAKTKSPGSQERNLGPISLKELITILAGDRTEEAK